MSDTQATTEQVAQETVPAGFRSSKFFFRAPSKKMIEENAAASLPAPIAREAVQITYAAITPDNYSEILNSGDEKQVAMFFDALNDIIESQVRKQLDEQPNYQQADVNLIDHAKLTWAAIANMPKAERASSAISEETWEAFKADYVLTMVEFTGKTPAVVENAAKIIAAEFRPVRDNNQKLATLETYLDTWFGATKKAAEFLGLYERLSKKVKDFQAKGLASLEI